MARSRAVMNASVTGGTVLVSALPPPNAGTRRHRPQGPGHMPAPGPDLVRTSAHCEPGTPTSQRWASRESLIVSQSQAEFSPLSPAIGGTWPKPPKAPYVRTVKAKSDATVVQVVYSSREIEHVGSAHDEGELEAMKAAAWQRMAAG
jgi:hypothetical protein